MNSMPEPFVPGDYSCNVDRLQIRLQRRTTPDSNIVGAYFNGNQFTVFQVYPEVDGIVWGRVSSATGEGYARYIGMRVNNNPKVRLEKAWVQDQPSSFEERYIAVLSRIANALEKIANR